MHSPLSWPHERFVSRHNLANLFVGLPVPPRESQTPSNLRERAERIAANQGHLQECRKVVDDWLAKWGKCQVCEELIDQSIEESLPTLIYPCAKVTPNNHLQLLHGWMASNSETLVKIFDKPLGTWPSYSSTEAEGLCPQCGRPWFYEFDNHQCFGKGLSISNTPF